MRWNHFVDPESELVDEFYNRLSFWAINTGYDNEVFNKRFLTHISKQEYDYGKFAIVDLAVVDAIHFVVKKSELFIDIYRLGTSFTLRSGHTVHFIEDISKEQLLARSMEIYVNWMCYNNLEMAK